MNQILIIEDDDKLCELFESILSQEEYDVYTAQDGIIALDILGETHIDLIVTDLMMPNMDGYELIQSIRQFNQEIPILVVSAKGAFNDKKQGFQYGADDYMVKPIDVHELVLRVEALLRRSKIVNSNRLEIGPLVLDQSSFTLTLNNESQALPQKEFLLLHKLLSYPNQIFTRQQLMDQIWGPDSETDVRTVDVHIKRLRDKFTDNGVFEIKTIRGLGYKAEVLVS